MFLIGQEYSHKLSPHKTQNGSSIWMYILQIVTVGWTVFLWLCTVGCFICCCGVGELCPVKATWDYLGRDLLRISLRNKSAIQFSNKARNLRTSPRLHTCLRGTLFSTKPKWNFRREFNSAVCLVSPQNQELKLSLMWVQLGFRRLFIRFCSCFLVCALLLKLFFLLVIRKEFPPFVGPQLGSWTPGPPKRLWDDGFPCGTAGSVQSGGHGVRSLWGRHHRWGQYCPGSEQAHASVWPVQRSNLQVAVGEPFTIFRLHHH